MKTIALVDPYWSGHHSMYLVNFSRALMQLGQRVWAFCPEPQTLTQWLTERGVSLEHWAAMPLHSMPSPVNSGRWNLRAFALRQIQYTAQALNAAERAHGATIDLVFFGWLDDFGDSLLFNFDFDRWLARPFSGLYFHPTHLRVPRRWMNWRRGPLDPDEAFRARSCRSVAVLDEGIAGPLATRLKRQVVCFPDITNPAVSALPTATEQTIAARARERQVIGLFGSLDKRKGLLCFIEQIDALPREKFFWVMAGALVESAFAADELVRIRQWLAHPPENVLLINGFLPDEKDFNGLIRACDLLYAVYFGFPHSSNMLTKGAHFLVPVVVADDYLLAERVKQFGLGFAVPANDAAAFRQLVLSPNTFALRKTAAFQRGCAEYVRRHNFERLVASFRQILSTI